MISQHVNRGPVPSLVAEMARRFFSCPECAGKLRPRERLDAIGRAVLACENCKYRRAVTLADDQAPRPFPELGPPPVRSTIPCLTRESRDVREETRTEKFMRKYSRPGSMLSDVDGQLAARPPRQDVLDGAAKVRCENRPLLDHLAATPTPGPLEQAVIHTAARRMPCMFTRRVPEPAALKPIPGQPCPLCKCVVPEPPKCRSCKAAPALEGKRKCAKCSTPAVSRFCADCGTTFELRPGEVGKGNVHDAYRCPAHRRGQKPAAAKPHTPASED